MKFATQSPQETIKLANKLGKYFNGGTVLALQGDLGAGKTHFTKGLAQTLNIKENITSPTFVLLKTYQVKKNQHGIKQLIHIDCYRLSNPNELLDLGWQEFINNPTNLIVVEWADKIKSILPPHTRWLNFKLGKSEHQRLICFK